LRLTWQAAILRSPVEPVRTNGPAWRP